MTNDTLIPWDLKEVTVTLSDGSRHTGTFDVTPEPGLYHVTRASKRLRPGDLMSPLVDLYAEDIVKIEPA